MKTAITELIERLDRLCSAIPNHTKHNKTVIETYRHAIVIASQYEEKEKKQITDAFAEGMSSAETTITSIEEAKDYFTNTFKK